MLERIAPVTIGPPPARSAGVSASRRSAALKNTPKTGDISAAPLGDVRLVSGLSHILELSGN